ncbi:glycosyltransferase family 4 protein [Clostridium sp. DJ247]|uniref:glycosyltransferase family 4 protein n=1 Tax=Clostridium sp. DJ247 TaxID=2726188 RepID=UPI001626E85C|nr:glycosyltransferase family 4 protein [Clostridium sp. DJ247]MBC2581548.1 glycosyltransferase family 4 protein [Clostridium sp. DJ247]
MNILFVTHESDLNGATLSLLGIIDILKKNNKIYVLTNKKSGKLQNELRKRNIKIIYMKYTWWMIGKSKNNLKWWIKRIIYFIVYYLNVISALKIKKVINEKKISIVHTNSLVINFGSIISKICNIPHVWHIREFGKEDHNLEFILPRKYSLDYISKNSEYIITVSKAICEKYKKDIDNNKILTIYNGVSLNNLQIKNFNKNKSTIDIIICGSISEAKCQSDAVLAISEIIKRGYTNVNLTIAGSGKKEKVEYLKFLINKNNLDKYVKLLGQVDNLVEVRENMDIELVCSKCEAFGRVTIEAMMSMIPVIGANTGGTTELIKDGYNGVLYKQGDYIDLANKIEKLINNKKLIKWMSINAYNFSKVFTAEANANNIYNIYRKAIQNFNTK